jgi:lipopolysaccharide/colanic/teichoic acid biosynthesis glycosyltransferase
MKRLGDMLIASVLLFVTFPLMVCIALAIKYESPGPVFERRERIGRDGRWFAPLKFRTTVHEREPAKLRQIGPVTGFGQFLRYTRIDELPQLINLLRGDLSLIDRSTHWRLFSE